MTRARTLPPLDATLTVSERRQLIVAELGAAPDWCSSRLLVAWMRRQGHWTRSSGQCDLRWLVQQGQIERRIEGGGTSASVWYRLPVGAR